VLQGFPYISLYAGTSLFNLWSTQDIFLARKIQGEGQSAGNFNQSCILLQELVLGSSETTREKFILNDDLFKFWLVEFVEGDGSFILNKNGYLEFKR
jgi:hypothetical protein